MGYLSFGHVHFMVLERFTAASSQQISDGRATLCYAASLSFDSQERCGRIDLQRSSSMRRDLEHLRFVERFDSCSLTRQKKTFHLGIFPTLPEADPVPTFHGLPWVWSTPSCPGETDARRTVRSDFALSGLACEGSQVPCCRVGTVGL